MKISNCLIALAVIIVGAGCRSADTPLTSTTTSPEISQNAPPQEATQEPASQSSGGSVLTRGSTGEFDYTVESIPNQRLTATSREGDKPTAVYSSNIIAVYVHPRNGATVSSTNSPAIPTPANNPEPARK